MASKNTEKQHIPNSMKRQSGIGSLERHTLQLDVATALSVKTVPTILGTEAKYPSLCIQLEKNCAELSLDGSKTESGAVALFCITE